MSTRKYRKKKVAVPVPKAVTKAATDYQSDLKPHECSDCGMRFSRISALKCHEKIHFNYELPHACPDCDRRFKSLTNRKLHMKTHRSAKSLSKTHRCTRCTKSFKKLSDLKMHFQVHNKKYIKKPNIPLKKPDVHATPAIKNTLSLSTTSTSAVTTPQPVATDGSLQPVQIQHTDPDKKEQGENPYCCPVCAEPHTTLASLEDHVRIHSGYKPYTCPHCSETFVQSESLNSHILIHGNQRRHECTECGKTFRHAANLKYHSYTHSGEKPFECTTCKKTFRREFTLKMHLLTHTGEKPHGCTICGKRFSQSNSLKDHLLTHSKEKPYVCDICHKGFKKPRLLTKHMVLHTFDNPDRAANGEMYDESNFKEDFMNHVNKQHPLEHNSPDVWQRQEELMRVNMAMQDKWDRAVSPAPSVSPVESDADDDDCLENAQFQPISDVASKKPNVCPTCGDGFKLPHVLAAHMKFHRGEALSGDSKPAQPSQGSEETGDSKSDSLGDSKSDSTSAAKPHKCPQCNKDFRLSRNLQTHMISHRRRTY